MGSVRGEKGVTRERGGSERGSVCVRAKTSNSDCQIWLEFAIEVDVNF